MQSRCFAGDLADPSLAVERHHRLGFSPRFQWPLFAVGLIAGSFEEIGWTGFATPRLQARRGLRVAVGPGALAPVGRFPQYTMGIAWPLEFAIVYLATLTPYRMLMMWVYSHTQSLLLAILMHAITGWLLVLFPMTSLAESVLAIRSCNHALERCGDGLTKWCCADRRRRFPAR